MWRKKKIEKEQEESSSFKDKLDWKRMMGGAYDLIVDNVPYLAFVSLLCVLYISNTHRAVETERALVEYNKELKELRWEYMDAKSQLMNVQIESEVIKSGNKIGLSPLSLPAYSVKKK
ncbi:MAG: FtsL-like putative cell division protein [Flavipsychrobacter sp.]